MSIFELHSEVLADYRDFVQAFFTDTPDGCSSGIDPSRIPSLP